MASVANSLYYPAVQVSSNQLRVTRHKVEGQIHLRRIEFRDEIEQTFSNAYSLVIRQCNQAANAEELGPHVHMGHCDKCYGFFLIDCNIAFDAYSKVSIQIMILPKHLPHGSAAPTNLKFNGRPDSFFRSNTIVSVQKTQSGSNQSTTS